MSTNWKNLSKLHKVLTVITCAAVIASIGVVLMRKMYSWTPPMDFTSLAFGVAVLCQTGLYWKTKRSTAVLFLVAGLFLLSGFLMELLL